MDEEPVVFDAADVTWPGVETLHPTKLVIGDFAVRLGPDGGEVVAAEDAIVFDLDGDEPTRTNEAILGWDGNGIWRLEP
jgi:hypothetical protein